ncbi:MAG: hypothetical protein WCT32_02510 [Patescibacteria group bacterium]|jgi:galactokinase/mevalonate kinase-like predicted kinase
MLKSPVRINLGGGWTDQTDWTGTKAVVNAAVGWIDGDDPDPFPLRMNRGSFHSKVTGIGTGLGISSIYAAIDFLHKHPKSDNDYIQYVLDWERRNGTKGGWQDQIGAITPGLKLIQTLDHVDFTITNRDNHPVFDHLVLFDSGVRRPSKEIGDRVRDLFETSEAFRHALEQNAQDTISSFWSDATTAAEVYIAGWKRLVNFVPEMAPAQLGYTSILDQLAGSRGWMHVGAGGGGWGIVFTTNPENRLSVIDQLSKHQIKAFEPVLLQGIQYS